MENLSSLLEKSAANHRHLCPRQVLGVRIGLLAGKVLDMDLPQTDKRLFAFVESDGCGMGGIAAASGCWVDRRTMRILDFGKLAATFVDTRTGATIRIFPHPGARIASCHYAPEDLGRWKTQLEAYKIMPDEDLLVVQRVKLTVSLKKIISRPGLRVNCSKCGEEITNEREVVVDGSIFCRACAGECYYCADTPESIDAYSTQENIIPIFEHEK